MRIKPLVGQMFSEDDGVRAEAQDRTMIPYYASRPAHSDDVNVKNFKFYRALTVN